MKNTKIATIATIVTAVIIALCGCVMTVNAETAETYEVEAVVIEMKVAFADVWEVIAVTEDGEKYGWFADNNDGEYWHIGDLALLTMLKGQTEEDDEVMDVILLGELTPVAVARWMNW